MALLRFLLWTAACIAAGIFLGTYDVGGGTAWQHAQRRWQADTPTLAALHAEARDWLEKTGERPAAAPTEHHSAKDKAAVQALISRRAQR